MNSNRIIFSLFITATWSMTLGWVGEFFDVGRTMALGGVLIGLPLGIIGARTDSKFTRSLLLCLPIGVAGGTAIAHLLLQTALGEYYLHRLPGNGEGAVGILGLSWSIVRGGIGVVVLAIGALLGSMIVGVSGLIGRWFMGKWQEVQHVHSLLNDTP